MDLMRNPKEEVVPLRARRAIAWKKERRRKRSDFVHAGQDFKNEGAGSAPNILITARNRRPSRWFGASAMKVIMAADVVPSRMHECMHECMHACVWKCPTNSRRCFHWPVAGGEMAWRASGVLEGGDTVQNLPSIDRDEVM